MRLGDIFLGKPLHWLLWGLVVVVLYALGSQSLHVKAFVPFVLVVLALAAGGVLVIFLTYRKGERITREPFEEDGA
jgi:preprotein translocase subunit SecY